ncbi:MAG: toprim domain-containing protein [candidate division NC10 bacterium]
MSFTDMALTAEDIKARLPIAYVLHLEGIDVEAEGGEYVCLNPFRPDSTPSFRVYASSEESDWLDRWNDFAEGTSGDVFDLIGRFDNTEKFVDHLDAARRIFTKFREDTWDGPTAGAPKKPFDVEAARTLLLRAQLDTEAVFIDDEHPIQRFLSARKDQLRNVSASWLVDHFRVGEDQGRIVIPFWNREGQSVLGYKTRYPDSRSYAAEGSLFEDVLYGEWLDVTPDFPVVLCEGETDAWSGTYVTQKDYVFLGLPTGAGAHPRQASRLAGRTVFIALDGDQAGRAATKKWADALLGEGCVVYVASLPDGKDLSDIQDVDGLLSRARIYETGIPGLGAIGRKYHSLTKDGKDGQQISDFVFDIDRVLRDELGAYTYNTQHGLLPAAALQTKNRFVSWCNDRGLVWAGSDTHTRHLDSFLKSQSIFVPTDEAVSVAGLYDGHFVWAEGSIGSRSVRFVPPNTGARVNLNIQLPRGEVDVRRQVASLLLLNDSGVMHPVLAWLAAAPVRMLFPQFPILNVSGGSGCGKTTLLQTAVPALTGSRIHMNLSGTTPFALLGHAGATNAFPVTFDEFRPGAKVATLEAMSTLLRDAYDANPSTKGGGDKWNELDEYATHAPIILSGEDAISETSHIDRCILVRMPVGDKPADVLERIQHWPEDHGLSHFYLRWLVERAFVDGWKIVVKPEGPDHLNDRQRFNLGVLRVGWTLLHEFVQECGGDGLPEMDLSKVTAEAEEAAATNPIREALEWALGDTRCAEFVWIGTPELGEDSSRLNVIVPSFVGEAGRAFVLPGGERAVRKYLEENYDAVHKRTMVMGQRRSFLSMPFTALGLDEVT